MKSIDIITIALVVNATINGRLTSSMLKEGEGWHHIFSQSMTLLKLGHITSEQWTTEQYTKLEKYHKNKIPNNK